MKLLSLRVKNFRAIDEQTVGFSDGITVVTGQNEVGKSSLVDAFDYLLRYKDSSNAQAIKLAQPVGRDAGPEVEAEFVIGDDHVRYRKRWLSAKETVLEYVAGPRSGTSVTSGAAHDAANELWNTLDLDLWEASRLMQATALNQSALHTSTSLQRALDAQAGGTVDETASGPLMEKVAAEVDQYYTATRNEKKILKDAASRVEEAERRLAAAQAEQDSLTASIDSLTALEADVSDRKKNLAVQNEELALLASRAEAALALQKTVDEAQKAVERAQRAAEEAGQKVEARAALVATAGVASTALDELKQKEKKSREDLAPLEESVAAEAKKLSALKAELVQVKKALAAAQLFERQNMARIDVDQLKKKLSEHDKLSSEIATLESSLVPTDKKTLGDIVELEQKIAVTEAAARAGAAQLRIETLAEEKQLLIDGTTTTVDTADPHDLPVLSQLTVELPGELRLTITPDAGVEDARSALDRVREELAELLEEAEVSSSAELTTMLHQYEEDSAKLERAKNRRTDRLEGRSAEDLRDELARQKAWLDKQDDAVEGDIDALTEKQSDLEADQAATDKVLGALREEQSRLRTDLAGMTGQVMNQTTVLDAATHDREQARSAVSDEELSTAFDAAQSALESARNARDKAVAELEESGGAAVITDHDLQVKHVEGLQRILSESRSEAKAARAVLTSKNRDAIQVEHDSAQSELVRAKAEYESLRTRAAAAKLLEDVLLKHQEETHRRYIEPFRAALRGLGQATYQDPSFDVDVAHDLTVRGRVLDGTLIPFESLSTGAREQMAILIRLATASLVAAEDAVPVLFDDTLGYSDRRRLHRVVEAISGSDRQIIIFTANADRFAGLTNAQRVQL